MNEKSIFNTARKIEEAQARDEYVRRACGENLDSLKRIRALLAEHQEDTDFLQSPPPGIDSDVAPTIMPGTSATASSFIGPYKLLQQIGEGGMGAVWMAEQEQPVKRRVALKLIRADMGSKEIVARFEAERQALAMMEHPNIARVLDAGTTEHGSPYFVMELVKGVPLNDFCDQNKLSIRERLELFVPICNAIQHAHQKGIIHRDLKPSNVLVALQDGKALPKVIDFGLAKALEHTNKLTDKTLFTEFGKVLGTLQYMSPEQAEMNVLDVDTRTDIYSLGVMLYELMTGSTPIEKDSLHKNAMLQVLALIREFEPPLPSVRLSSSGDKATGISAQRKIAPRKLQQTLRGDLDWMVMKAIDKDRPRRYETANGLAMDIQRYLDGEAVLAAPPSTTYRIRKFVTRNRYAVLTASLVLLSMVAGTIGTTWGMFWAINERAKVVAQAETASTAIHEANEIVRTSVSALAQEFDDLAQPNIAMSTTAQIEGAEVDTLATATKELATVLVSSLEKEARSRRDAEKVAEFQARQLSEIEVALMGSRLRTDLLESIRKYGRRIKSSAAEIDTRISEVERLVEGADFTAIAAQSLKENVFDPALETIDQEYDEQPLIQAQLLASVGNAMRELGLPNEARKPLENALTIRRNRLGNDNVDTLDSIADLAELLRQLDMNDQLRPLQVEALQGRLKILGERHEDTISSMWDQPRNLIEKGEYDLVEPLTRKILALCRETFGNDHKKTVTAIHNLGVLLTMQEKYADAEGYLREAIERAESIKMEPVAIAGYLLSYGSFLRNQGKHVEGVEYFQQALAIYRLQLGSDHPTTLRAIGDMAFSLKKRGQWEDAERFYDESLAGYRRVFGSLHHETLTSISSLGLLTVLNKHDRGEALLREAAKGFEQTLGKDNPDTLDANLQVGYAIYRNKRYSEAEPLLRKSLEDYKRVFGENDRRTLKAQSYWGYLLMDQGKLVAAEKCLRENMEKSKSIRGVDSQMTLHCQAALARTLKRLGRYPEAIALGRETLKLTQQTLGDRHPDTLDSMAALERALRMSGRYPEAIALGRETLKLTQQTLGDRHPDTLSSMAALAMALEKLGQDDESESLKRTVLEVHDEISGEENESTINAANNYGWALNKNGKHKEALETLSKYEQAARNVYTGQKAGDLSNYLLKIGQAQTGLGQFAAAESTLNEAFPILSEKFGKQHAKVKTCIQTFVALYDGWHIEDSDAGHDAKAAQWKEKLNSNEAQIDKQ